jgi:hypothetical protein
VTSEEKKFSKKISGKFLWRMDPQNRRRRLFDDEDDREFVSRGEIFSDETVGSEFTEYDTDWDDRKRDKALPINIWEGNPEDVELEISQDPESTSHWQSGKVNSILNGKRTQRPYTLERTGTFDAVAFNKVNDPDEFNYDDEILKFAANGDTSDPPYYFSCFNRIILAAGMGNRLEIFLAVINIL